MSVVAFKRREDDVSAEAPAPLPLESAQLSEDPLTQRLRIALALSVLVHAAILTLFMFIPQQKPVVEKQPRIVVLELAALGKPEAEEEKPAPPPPPEQKAPEAPPAVEQKPPEPQPLPEIAPPPVPETPPAPQAEPVPAPPKVTARPVPKPEIAPPVPKEPEPRPEAPPVAAAPSPSADTPQRPTPPEPAPAPAPPDPTPGQGIRAGVGGSTPPRRTNRYVTTLFTMIDAKKEYPPQSLQRREQGTVVVKLEIAADGKLVEASSPTEDPKRLVDASLEAVRKAAPFPPLPTSLKQAEAEFQVPVVYKLQ